MKSTRQGKRIRKGVIIRPHPLLTSFVILLLGGEGSKQKNLFYMKKKLPKKFITKPPQAEAIEVRQSPSIPRWIPEIRVPAISLVPGKEVLVGFVCGCLVVGIGFSTLHLFDRVKDYQHVLEEKQILIQQKTYWQSVTRQFPNYRDAHFRLGVLEYQEGKKAEAKTEIAKALDLDPSFTEARDFLQKINQ